QYPRPTADYFSIFNSSNSINNNNTPHRQHALLIRHLRGRRRRCSPGSAHLPDQRRPDPGSSRYPICRQAIQRCCRCPIISARCRLIGCRQAQLRCCHCHTHTRCPQRHTHRARPNAGHSHCPLQRHHPQLHRRCRHTTCLVPTSCQRLHQRPRTGNWCCRLQHGLARQPRRCSRRCLPRISASTDCFLVSPHHHGSFDAYARAAFTLRKAN
ncbi:hypothetical protein CC86DRAFT_463399, partial [Ophiobolus disseminans]